MNAHIKEIADPKNKSDEKLLCITDFDGLMALVQSATLEVHPRGTTIDSWEKPDMITMDIDPAEDVPWRAVIGAAQELKRRLEADGLKAFVKISGGKSLHVVTPLWRHAGWAQVTAYAKGLAEQMSMEQPDSDLAVASKDKRSGRFSSMISETVAAYSTRARAGAAVSMPLAWHELTDDISPPTLPSRMPPLG